MLFLILNSSFLIPHSSFPRFHVQIDMRLLAEVLAQLALYARSVVVGFAKRYPSGHPQVHLDGDIATNVARA